MSLTGNLKTMDLPELLQWIALGRKTGSLTLIRGKTKNCILFQDGRIISSRSNEPTRQLGHFLLFKGKLTEHELRDALEVQRKTGQLLGKILVEQGVINTEDVEKALIQRTEEVIYDLFLWDDAQFHFTPGGFCLKDLILIDLEINAILFEGVRRKDEWTRVRAVFPDNNAVLALRAADDLRGFELTSLQKKLLYLATRGMSIAQMILHLHGSDFTVNFELLGLYEQGLIEVKKRIVLPKKESEAARIFRKGLEFLRLSRYREAILAFQAAQRADPACAGVEEQIELAERALCEDIYQRSLPAYKVPYLKVSEVELRRYKLSHEEGFVATRINGTWDVRTIVMLSPLRELDILQGLERMLRLGLVGLR